MRNIILLIRHSSVLLTFLLLQIVSITMLVKYSRSHKALYLETAFEATGYINKRYGNFTQYFSLGENNRKLAEENARLRNLVSSNFALIDSLPRPVLDTLMIDSSRVVRKYLWRNARVINNSVNAQNNYLTLERGRLQGVETEMAVMGPGGIVGRVTDVSDNMCIVMSLLHRKSAISVSHKNSGLNGILQWDGVNPQLVQLKDIPKSTKIKGGDTILTSNISLNFPPGLMVGTIIHAEIEKGNNNYLIQVKPGTNFFNLQYADIIENLMLKEQKALEQRGKKQE